MLRSSRPENVSADMSSFGFSAFSATFPSFAGRSLFLSGGSARRGGARTRIVTASAAFFILSPRRNLEITGNEGAGFHTDLTGFFPFLRGRGRGAPMRKAAAIAVLLFATGTAARAGTPVRGRVRTV